MDVIASENRVAQQDVWTSSIVISKLEGDSGRRLTLPEAENEAGVLVGAPSDERAWGWMITKHRSSPQMFLAGE